MENEQEIITSLTEVKTHMGYVRSDIAGIKSSLEQCQKSRPCLRKKKKRKVPPSPSPAPIQESDVITPQTITRWKFWAALAIVVGGILAGAGLEIHKSWGSQNPPGISATAGK